MKKIILLLLLLFSLNLHAQKVAGVWMGATYETCKVVLDNRFNGGEQSFQLIANEISYRNVTFANQKFDSVTFYFQSDGERTYLYRIFFLRSFPKDFSKEAMYIRDELKDLYEENYDTYEWWIPEGNPYKCYKFYNDNTDSFYCEIILFPSSWEGKKEIALTLSYEHTNYIEDDI